MNKDLLKLADDLEQLEKLRRQTRNSILFIGFVFLLLIFVGYRMTSGKNIAFIPIYYAVMCIGMALLGALPLTVAKIRRRYKKLYNAVIVRNSLDRYFEIEEFNSDYGIPQQLIESTNMIRTGNNYKTDDLIRGRYKDIQFMQSDVLMQDRAGADLYSNRNSITYFKGRWMIFEFNKRFKCDLMVFEKAFMITGKKHSLFLKSGIEKVEFESSEFNEHFDSYTNNQTEAFYVMTPHMMEAIEDLRKNTHGALLLCFKNNVLHVGVNSWKWAFEPPIFKSIDVSSVGGEIESDIMLITQFVDGLKLDEKIYMN
jgi:hypothetical protein